MCIYIYIYICMCVCVSIFATQRGERWRGRLADNLGRDRGREGDQSIAVLDRFDDRWANPHKELMSHKITSASLFRALIGLN